MTKFLCAILLLLLLVVAISESEATITIGPPTRLCERLSNTFSERICIIGSNCNARCLEERAVSGACRLRQGR
ncbi:putative knottin, scorpion toxin-like superfamily [Helianthus annuus]|nr:putative knottin, scorpion toxin-like superfamily [Helianthus annuus]